MKSKETAAIFAKRLLIFCVGQFILACGVVLAAKSDLGASSTTVIPNVIYNICLDKGFTVFDLGAWTTIVYCGFILVQLLILRKDFKLLMLTEIAVSFLFGYFVSMAQRILSIVPSPESYPLRLIYMVISIPIMALGVVVYIQPQLAQAPGEGLTSAMSLRFGWSIPTSKLILDISLVAIAAVLSLVYFHGFVGIREGTIICAAVFGPTMKPMMALLQKPLMEFCGTQTKRDAAMAQAQAAALDPSKFIITVDWETGSDGDLFARELAEKLGAKMFSNDELVAMEIAESGLPERFVTTHERLMRFSAVHDYATYAYTVQVNLDPLDQLYAAQVEVVRKIAATEQRAIILGHCGNYILKDDPNCFRIFMHADMRYRLRRTGEKHEFDEAASRVAVGATDHSRAKYHHDFTGETWGQAKGYDLTLSTSSFTKENSEQLIMDALEKWKESRSA